MKRPSPKKTHGVTQALILASAAVTLFVGVTGLSALLAVSIPTILGALIFRIVFYKCPHCNARLNRRYTEICPYCGQNVETAP